MIIYCLIGTWAAFLLLLDVPYVEPKTTSCISSKSGMIADIISMIARRQSEFLTAASANDMQSCEALSIVLYHEAITYRLFGQSKT